MRTDNQSCRQISVKQGYRKKSGIDWSNDGRRNPSDLGTKVPASRNRLRADFVECIGDSVQEAGRAD